MCVLFWCVCGGGGGLDAKEPCKPGELPVALPFCTGGSCGQLESAC